MWTKIAAFFGGILAVVGVLLVTFSKGKRAGKNQEIAKNNSGVLKSVEAAKKSDSNNSNPNDHELSRWLRDNTRD